MTTNTNTTNVNIDGIEQDNANTEGTQQLATKGHATVHQSQETAKREKELGLIPHGAKLIIQHYRSPSRSAAVWVQGDAWAELEASETPASYKPLLSAVLETAAKSILKKRLESMTVWPTTIDTSIFSAEAILSEASGANTDWLSKEELTQAWEQSATRKAFITNPAYATNKAYRGAVAAFADLVLKLAGKTSSYQEAELDKIMVKLAEADHDTEFGSFVLRRCEALRNKPQKAAIDLDLL
jgi:hypothetical protein